MSYTVLARRYRSTTFDEVIGQEHIARTLKRAIESGRIAHAYLFCGTRGTGKTSSARILAKALNCLSSDSPVTVPCNQCDSCQGIARGDDIDVIEIDAASNTGVDNVREIIENAAYRPARARFKIYIVDEVHMLSKNAFNALLKILEEPPGHVKFILATTEPEKVLPTILSRCQRYDFRNIPTREIAAHLKNICAQEKIGADEDALLLVAKAGAGSMRDSLSLLDRLLSLGEDRLSVDLIEQLLGLPRSQLVFDLSQAIGEGDVKSVLQQTDAMITAGQSPDGLIASLVDHLRNLLILRACGGDAGLVDVPGMNPKDLQQQASRFDPVVLTQDITILEELRRLLRQSQASRALLDATLVRLALAEQFTSIGDLLSRVQDIPTGVPAQKKKPDLTTPSDSSPSRQSPSRGIDAPPVALAAPGSVIPESPPSSIPAPSMGINLDDDDDDDLPRPGKVWESNGPSLSELLKQQSTASATAAQPAPTAPTFEKSNVEAVDPKDVAGIWQALLQALSGHASLPGLLNNGRYIGVQDGRAIIQYSSRDEHLVKLLERNGKKDLLTDAFSRILGMNVGVMFSIDTTDAQTQRPPASARPAPRHAPRHAHPEPAERAMPDPPPGVRLTPELKESLEQQPLIRAVISELGGSIVKVD